MNKTHKQAKILQLGEDVNVWISRTYEYGALLDKRGFAEDHQINDLEMGMLHWII
jgi:hypothetical protein